MSDGQVWLVGGLVVGLAPGIAVALALLAGWISR
jgi:hypothetical protein